MFFTKGIEEMEINKPLKSEQSILLSARKAVVVIFAIFAIYIFFSSFLLGYGKEIYFGGWNINKLPFFKRLITLPVAVYENNADYYSMIFFLLTTTYAIFCGRLYNVMSGNIILSFIIGILIICLSWVALGIVTHLLTIYLLVKSNKALEKIDLNSAIPSKKISSLILTEENKISIPEEVLKQESKVKKDSEYDKAYQKASYFIDKEEYEKALPCLEIAIKTDKLSLQKNAHIKIGFCYGKLDNHTKAIEAYTQAIRISPEDASIYYNLGTAYNSLSLYKDAIRTYTQAIRINSEYTNAYINLGFAYAQLALHEDGIENYKKAIRINPNNAKPHFGLGSSYFKIGDKSSALDEYKILKKLDINLANKLFDLIY